MTVTTIGDSAREVATTTAGHTAGAHVRQPADARESATATIASGASLSAAIDLGGATLSGIVVPASWTTANLTFQVSLDGTTWYDLYADGAEVSVAATAGKMHRVSIGDWLGWRHVKIRSGTTGAPVNQAADRTLTLATVW